MRRPHSPARFVGIFAWVGATVVLVAPLALLPGSAALEIRNTPVEIATGVAFLLLGPVYAMTGATIISRRPGNSVGWMMMAVGLGVMLSMLADILEPTAAPSSVSPWLAVIFGLVSASWVFFIFPIFHLLLTFPTGRALSPGWRVFTILELVMASLTIVGSIFGELVVSVTGAWTVENPIGFIPMSVWSASWFDPVWTAGLLVLTVGGLASIIVRHRRAHSVERQQIKSLLFAVTLFALVFGGGAVLIRNPEEPSLFDILLPIALMGIAVAIALSVLRYRLYDIDRIISRTVAYALVVGLLGLLVAGVAAVAGSQFETPWVVAATTLGVAALFNPVRTRMQGWVDRRFNRSRYDAELVMDDFAGSLRDRVNTDEVVEGWLGVVDQTMQPETIGVWLRV
jgi:hypothetical protein